MVKAAGSESDDLTCSRAPPQSICVILDIDLALKVGRVYRQIVTEYIDSCWEDLRIGPGWWKVLDHLL